MSSSPTNSTPSSVEDLAKEQYRQWLQNQIFGIMQTTRMLKTSTMMAVISNELPPGTRKWLYDEFLQMAQIVEVKE